MNRLCLALDGFDNCEKLTKHVEDLRDLVKLYKVGLESFTSFGWESVQNVCELDCEVFLDLKLHDIPKTVERTVKSIVRQCPISYLTVHTMGGLDMLKAAVEGAQGKTKIIGVTVLTSLSDYNLRNELNIHISLPFQIHDLAHLAIKAGLDGVVCSAEDLPIGSIPHGFLLVTPGISLGGEKYGDQERTLSPQKAIRNGADILVVGRTVNDLPQLEQKQMCIRYILKEIESGLQTNPTFVVQD